MAIPSIFARNLQF